MSRLPCDFGEKNAAMKPQNDAFDTAQAATISSTLITWLSVSFGTPKRERRQKLHQTLTEPFERSRSSHGKIALQLFECFESSGALSHGKGERVILGT